MAVGNGSSYHRAARTARTTNGWSRRQVVRPRRSKGANGTLAGDWVGRFAPIVCGPVLDGESWPEVVALDDLPFVGSRPRQANRRAKQETSWVVFGAYANPVGAGGQLFRLHASPKLDSKHAAAWLRSIPGRPKVVVADGSGVWAKAVKAAWPAVIDEKTGEVLEEAPRLARCEYHLGKTLRAQLRATGVLPPRDEPSVRPNPALPWPLNMTNGRRRPAATPPANPGSAWTPKPHPRKRTGMRAFPAIDVDGRVQLSQVVNGDQHPLAKSVHPAFDSVEAWDEMVALAVRWQARPLGPWLARNGPTIRAQIAARSPAVPRSIGGLEGSLRIVRTMITERAHLLNNTVRTNRLLDLVTLQIRGLAEERVYAERIAQAAAAGGSIPQQRNGVTGGPRLHS
jgi:hypothetical protein